MASAGSRNVLVVAESAAEEVAEFIVLSAEVVGRVMLPALPSMVLS
jgi:hypothetical protein